MKRRCVLFFLFVCLVFFSLDSSEVVTSTSRQGAWSKRFCLMRAPVVKHSTVKDAEVESFLRVVKAQHLVETNTVSNDEYSWTLFGVFYTFLL